MTSTTLEPTTAHLEAAAALIDDELATAAAPVDRDRTRAKRGPSLFWVLLLATAGLLVAWWGVRWWLHARSHAVTDNAYVAANIHQISSRLSGTVTEVLVSDNQSVEPGTALLKLDARDFELRVQQASNQISQAAAQLAQAKAQLSQAKAQLAQADAKSAKAAAELQRAHLDFERAQHLTEGGRFATISKQEFDASQSSYDVAKASAQAAQADFRSSQALVQAAQAAEAGARAQCQTAEVSLADAKLQLSYTVIAAPVKGTIGRKGVEAGQRVQPGQALLAVVSDQKWIVANFKETQLAHMSAGQPVLIHLDAIPGQAFRGTVESFSPASGAQFALLPPDNATGNFTKVVQRVPVKIVFAPEAIRGCEARIVPGLSAVVEVALERNRS